ncbi:two-component regulator propeller domain-containing protein [Mucilaginibacter sp.]|uniref:sensor histidine kinase n=1 Tax=Mucilaginibacter sp. TaxID=1882438 RepID=UPI003266F07E
MIHLPKPVLIHKQLFIIVGFLVISIYAKSQSPYYFIHYKVENGLSNNKVRCFAQDKNGLRWFGTIDGLNRLYGYTFKTSRNDLLKTGSLGNNFINTLQCDEQDNLWVGIHKGLYKYDPMNKSFEHVPFAKDHSMNAIKNDSKGNLWCAIGSKNPANLYSNAIKYAHREVKIMLKLNVEQNLIEVEFQNDGNIIIPEMKSRIFEPCLRIKEGETQTGWGLG